jgi:hypothetical protein
MTGSTRLSEDLHWLSTHPRTRQRAWGHNFIYDPTIDPRRMDTFEAEFDSMHSSPDFDAGAHDGHAILQAHVRYYDRWVVGGVEPQTFSDEGELAAIPKFVETIWLVRFELLTRPLLWAGKLFPEIKEAFDAGARRDPSQSAALRQFLDRWNENAWNTPRFAALETEVRRELNAPDWAERLRTRFGLADWSPRPGERLPVAVMMYRASEVRRLCRGRAGLTSLFTRPTALDQKPYEYFYPAPARMNGGRCMQLRVLPKADGGLISELLHPKIPYRIEHIFKIGEITTAAPDESLRSLRNHHLDLLRDGSGDAHFGAVIPEDVID